MKAPALTDNQRALYAMILNEPDIALISATEKETGRQRGILAVMKMEEDGAGTFWPVAMLLETDDIDRLNPPSDEIQTT